MKPVIRFLFLILVLISLQADAQVPTDTAGLKARINADISPNGNKQITAIKLNQILNGIVNLMKSNAVDSGYMSGDTLILVRRGYTNFKLVLPSGTGGTEADPTVPSAVKALTSFNISNWNNKQDALSQGNGISILGNIISAKKDSAQWNSDKIQGNAISTTAPATGQVLKWNGSAWAPGNDSAGGSGGGGYTPPGDVSKILDGTGAAIPPTKSLVGLNLADNTPDASKPVSTAMAAALNTRVQSITRINDSTFRFNIGGTNTDIVLAGGAVHVAAKYPLVSIPGPAGTSDSIACPTCGAGSAAPTVFYPSIAAMLSAAVPADSTVIQTAEFTPGKNGGGLYRYLAGSTATANGYTIFGTVGRYHFIPVNGQATFPQVGVFETADMTTAANAALVAITALGAQTTIPENFMVIADPNAGGLKIPKRGHLAGTNAKTSIVKSKAYTASTVGKRLISNLAAAGRDTTIILENLTVDGNTAYSGNQTAGSSPVKDSLSSLVSLSGVDSFTLKNLYVQNGGNYDGVHIYDSKYGNITDNTLATIGGININNDFDSLCYKINVARNKNYGAGYRWRWDLSAPGGANWRQGDDWARLGGRDLTVEYNEVWNINSIKCFNLEAWGLGTMTVNKNKVHGSGNYYGGYSLGGIGINSRKLTKLIFTNNTTDSVGFPAMAAKDSVSGRQVYFAGFAYNELYWLDTLDYSGNTFPNHTNSIEQGYKYARVHNNILDNSGVVLNYPAGNGSGIMFNPNIKVTGTDSVGIFELTSNSITTGLGRVLRLQSGGTFIKSARADSNYINVDGGDLAEVYDPTGSNGNTNVGMNNNIIVGSIPYRAIFYSVGAGRTFNFKNNDINTTNIDPASNLSVNTGSNAMTIDQTGTSALALRNNSGVLEAQVKLGVWKPQFTLTSGGGSLTRQSITSGTSATVSGGDYIVQFNFSSPASTFSLTLPAAPTDKQQVIINAGGTLTYGDEITGFTLLPNTGQTIVGFVSPRITVGDQFSFIWNSTTSQWVNNK